MLNKSILHTKSDYALGTASKYYFQNSLNFDFLQKKSHLNQDIGKLEAQEKKLYRTFQANDYQGFIRKIQGLFNQNDRDVIQKFGPSSLESIQSFVQPTLSQKLFGQTVDFIFNFNNVPSNDKNFRLRDPNLTPVITQKTFDAAQVKEIMNQYFKGHNFRGNNWTTNLNSFVMELIAKRILTVSLTNPKQVGTMTCSMNDSLLEVKNFPWGLTKDQYDLALKLDQSQQQNNLSIAISNAVDQIHNFIFNQLGRGGSQDLVYAMNKAWDQTFPRRASGKQSYDAALFFSGGRGSNFAMGVMGALGEFQTAVIFEYVFKKMQGVQGSQAAYVAKILGNQVRNGEKIKTDVALLGLLENTSDYIGIQVKNVGQTASLALTQDLETNIHPDKFSKLIDLDEKEKNSFFNFIANYYFNTSYQTASQGTMSQTISWIREFLPEIMNFNVNGNGSVSDTVSFYFVSGKYFIPASAFFKIGTVEKLKNSICITSGYEGKSDNAYVSESSNRGDHPLFVDYWRHPISGWTQSSVSGEVQKNFNSVYNSLVNKRISIRTYFNLTQALRNYQLFP